MSFCNRFSRIRPESVHAQTDAQRSQLQVAEVPPRLRRHLDLWGDHAALLEGCDSGGNLNVELLGGERFHGTFAEPASRGWIRILDAQWLNGPSHLRDVRRPTLIFHKNVAWATWEEFE